MKSAGKTDSGRQRTVNEDRLHVDPSHGLFIVVDGVGGQAAGGKAADVALGTLRKRLERANGSAPNRLRDALTLANNEIHRLAGTRPEWNGMACVATVLVVDGPRAFVGHVGDTRLYKISPRGIGKITHDHSPVGEREDSGELSELEAMRHGRRNEVYRDLGSDRHEPGDPDFIEIAELGFEPDSAFLLCSDGLTDLVESAEINEVVTRLAGAPDRVVAALVEAANRAGGKDNVTVVYVEGDRFAASPRSRANVPIARSGKSNGQPAKPAVKAHEPESPAGTRIDRSSHGERHVRLALLAALLLLLSFSTTPLPRPAAIENPIAGAATSSGQLVVRQGESIANALRRAAAGDEVIVEPGEYREALSLPANVRLVSRVPLGAILRLPANARETDAAAVAAGVSGAALVGFRIMGDSTTALGTGLLLRDSEVSIIDTEISGARNVAIDVAGASRIHIMASDVHDNPGAALAVRSGASARVVHNVFRRNGVSPQTAAPIILGENADLKLASNMFYDLTPAAFRALGESDRDAIARDNWFSASHPSRTAAPARPRGAGQQPGRPGPAVP